MSEPPGVVLDVGEHLADYVIVYENGAVFRQPIRRRFEINDVVITWGQLAAAARPHRADLPRDWRAMHAAGDWGYSQTGVHQPEYAGVSETELPRLRPVGNYWIFAMPSKYHDVPITEFRVEFFGSTPIAIAGITLFRGKHHPLRYGQLKTLRVTSTAPTPPSVEIDLGVVARRYPQLTPGEQSWLAEQSRGLGTEPRRTYEGVDLIDIVGSDSATLNVAGALVDLEDVAGIGELALPKGVRIEFLPTPRIWVEMVTRDSSSRRATPARVHVRTQDGRYVPPYGHRREVNDMRFQDYGADLKLGDMEYAYVDGTFRVQLPVGDAYIEVTKGFEYQPIRRRIRVSAQSRTIDLDLERTLDWRERGWVTADTHVHFLPQQTARLEAQAEGVNVVNLLTTQFGDFFSNISDWAGPISEEASEDTIVRMGSENRHHFLGHIGLLGTAELVTPLSTGGPSESFFGESTSVSLADWADACHSGGGLAIAAHFPEPQCEVAADVILGKIDAVEISDFWSGADTYAVREWYRFLNCGFPVPVVGGTDKMSAGMPLGGIRTYADIGREPLTFERWAAAVRRGRTFTTSGPLIELSVDGYGLGDRIPLPRGGRTLSVEAKATSHYPLQSIELIHNGQVIAADVAQGSVRELALRISLRASEPGWLAARCASTAVAWQAWPVHLAAHTSPIYIGRITRALNEGDPARLASMLDLGVSWLDTLSTAADTSSHRRLHRVYEKARHRLSRRS